MSAVIMILSTIDFMSTIDFILLFICILFEYSTDALNNMTFNINRVIHSSMMQQPTCDKIH